MFLVVSTVSAAAEVAKAVPITLLVGAVGGGAAVWLLKDTIQKWIMGAEAYVASLQSKIAKITPPKL